MTRIGLREILRRDDGLIPTPVTVLGVTLTIMFAVLVAVAAGTAGMVHKKNTEKVGGMTFQQVLDSDTPKATPTPAPQADNSGGSNSQPAQQVQPVEPSPQVVVIGGGTDNSSSSGSGSSSSSSSTTKTPCPASPMFPIPTLQESHSVPLSNMTPEPPPGC